jgi:anaerobic selenocysteine-containing dehydrogenase
MLPAVTGAWRDAGGGLARSTQVYFETALRYPARGQRWRRRAFNMARLGSVLTDHGLDPPIRALVVHNSNPAVICPDQNRVLEGLARADLFTVVIEQFMTDTARHADIVLPATTQIEHLDLGIAWGHLYLSLNRPAIAPLGQSLPNTEIFRRLAAAMGLDRPELRDSDETMIRQLLSSDHPWLRGITYEHLASNAWARLDVPPGYRPHADTSGSGGTTPRLVLGPLVYEPGAETPHGDRDLSARYPLALLTRKQHVGFLNASYGGFERHLPTAPPSLQIHASDAAERKIGHGDQVRVFNDRGALTLAAAISDEVRPGLVAAPFGWWHRHAPEGRAVNALTNPSTPPGDIGSAAFHETLVEVKRVNDPRARAL